MVAKYKDDRTSHQWLLDRLIELQGRHWLSPLAWEEIKWMVSQLDHDSIVDRYCEEMTESGWFDEVEERDGIQN